VLLFLVNFDRKRFQLKNIKSSRLLGICSGFAGVYMEKIFKNTVTSLWIYNTQLAAISIIFTFVAMYIFDGHDVNKHGILYNYTTLVWISTVINSIGGLTVALVLKYSDNILKGFASSASLVLSCIIAMKFFDFQLTILFSIGSLFVVSSIIIYSSPELILSIPIFKLCFKDNPVFV
jgi:UDP-sugar transporter A1/2/3